MKKSVLVLGSGNSSVCKIVVGRDGESTQKGTFQELFHDVWTIDHDPGANPRLLWDLEQYPWPVPKDYFEEVHAYEVLEHLGAMGDYKAFFQLFKQIWDSLRVGGLLCASTPWWESVWVWQDPGHRRSYSPQLLQYLDQAEYKKQVGVTAMTDYRGVWHPPYTFTKRFDAQTGEDPRQAGYSFVLQKEEWNEG